jgi:hypothetical protein
VPLAIFDGTIAPEQTAVRQKFGVPSFHHCRHSHAAAAAEHGSSAEGL